MASLYLNDDMVKQTQRRSCPDRITSLTMEDELETARRNPRCRVGGVAIARKLIRAERCYAGWGRTNNGTVHRVNETFETSDVPDGPRELSFRTTSVWSGDAEQRWTTMACWEN